MSILVLMRCSGKGEEFLKTGKWIAREEGGVKSGKVDGLQFVKGLIFEQFS